MAEDQQVTATDLVVQTRAEPAGKALKSSSKQQEETVADGWISGLDPATQAQMELWNLPTSFGQPISNKVDTSQPSEDEELDYGQEA